jgi:hypothetical protein
MKLRADETCPQLDKFELLLDVYVTHIMVLAVLGSAGTLAL